MRDGRLRIVTFPLSAVTVTGYGVATTGFAAAIDGDAITSARTASAAESARRPDMAASPPPFREGARLGERGRSSDSGPPPPTAFPASRPVAWWRESISPHSGG